MTKLYTCPGCGYRVFDGPPGTHDICPVCDWQDDDVQLRFPASNCGANVPGLVGHQAKVLPIAALPKRSQDLERDPNWRPLEPHDLVGRGEGPQSGLEYFQSIDDKQPDYYWLRVQN